MERYLTRWLLLAALLLSLGAIAAGTEHPKLARLVFWSDIHAGGSHFDSHVWDVARTQGLADHPDALVLAGDVCDNSHDRATFYDRLRAFLTTLDHDLKAVKTPLLLALGNDDLPGNYQTDPETLLEVQKVYQETLGSRYYLNELGNGVYPGSPAGMVWLTINGTIFCPNNHYAGAKEQARVSMAWLEEQLKAAGRRPVVILTHIPPTWDLYSKQPAWKPKYLRQLRLLMLDHAGSITILGGHFHRNHVQVYKRPQGNVPVLTGGALANKFGYNPNWRTYRWSLDAQGAPSRIQYDVRYPNHPDWTSHYDIAVDQLPEFYRRLKFDNQAYGHYLLDLYDHHQDEKDWARTPEIRESILKEFWVKH